MNGVSIITLRSMVGGEKRMLAWLPTEETRQNLISAASRNGVSIEESHKI